MSYYRVVLPCPRAVTGVVRRWVSAADEARAGDISRAAPLRPRQRSYHRECTGSRPITEVKRGRARLVLSWVTGLEHLVLLAFFCLFFFLFLVFLLPSRFTEGSLTNRI